MGSAHGIRGPENTSNEGIWDIITVGSDPSGYTGYDNEIALDSNEYPRIVYVWDIDWEYIPYLKHAWFDGSVWHSQQLTDGSESVEYPTTIGIDRDRSGSVRPERP